MPKAQMIGDRYERGSVGLELEKMAVRLVARSIVVSSGPLLFAAAIRDPRADEGANQPVRPIWSRRSRYQRATASASSKPRRRRHLCSGEGRPGNYFRGWCRLATCA